MNALLMAALLGAEAAAANDGYWIGSSGASWAGAVNWDAADGIAGGVDNTAYFGFGRESIIGPNSTFTIDGARTIGNLCFTTQNGPGNWSFNTGTTGPLTLGSTFQPAEITVTSPLLKVTFNAVMAGVAGVEKDGPGSLVLAAKNSYSGPTLVSGGELNVSGTIGPGGVEVAKSAALSGTGVILGPVVVDSGGVLAVGNPLGSLTISNSLTLRAGSTTYIGVDGTTSGHAAVNGLTSITYGGTLLVTNLSGTLSLGQSFSIFGSAPASGNFSSVIPPPGPWLRWRTDPATGQIFVVSSAAQPVLSFGSFSGTNLVVQVSGGPPGSTGYIMTCSDLGQPQSAWSLAATNVFDMSGTFSFTNAVGANGASQMYLAVSVFPAP